MTTQNTNPWLAMPSETAEFEVLEPGSYDGVCIGITMREFTSKEGIKTNKVQFVFEICEGAQQYFLRSKPCSLVLNEKSNLFQLIQSWTKASMERVTAGFSCDKMVGFGAQIIVSHREVNGRTYADIASVLPLKKGVKVEVTPAEIPTYLGKGALKQLWAPGITVKPEKAVVAPAAPAAAMPFHANPGAPLPNQGLSVTQPALNPQATADPVVPEADDSSEDLPF